MELLRLIGNIIINNTNANRAIRETAEEANDGEKKVSEAFITSGHSSEAAKNTYSDLNSILGDTGQAVEAAQHLALVADNEDELSEMTHTLTGVYATFGASLPLEGLAEAINHSASLGEVQGSLADALEWSGITVDDFNAQLAVAEQNESIVTSINRLYDLISRYMPMLMKNTNIFLDTGVLVGQLSPLIDEELGNIEARRLRGNI